MSVEERRNNMISYCSSHPKICSTTTKKSEVQIFLLSAQLAHRRTGFYSGPWNDDNIVQEQQQGGPPTPDEKENVGHAGPGYPPSGGVKNTGNITPLQQFSLTIYCPTLLTFTDEINNKRADFCPDP